MLRLPFPCTLGPTFILPPRRRTLVHGGRVACEVLSCSGSCLCFLGRSGSFHTPEAQESTTNEGQESHCMHRQRQQRET